MNNLCPNILLYSLRANTQNALRLNRSLTDTDNSTRICLTLHNNIFRRT
jgi:hypothetical protein